MPSEGEPRLNDALLHEAAGGFEKRCNLAMVDLEPVAAEAEVMERMAHQMADLHSHGLVDVMSNMGSQDAERLYEIIKRHQHYTGSERARTILGAWEDWLPRFRKVMPVEYRRALSEMGRQQKADKTGLGVLEIGLPIVAEAQRQGARK